ncbi:MAG: DUF1992 domain-containing protein [Mycobacteriales bacterium]
MTERKPTGMSWESFVDRQILDAAERGEFDDLPGKGKPIPGRGEPYNELWWVQSKVSREGLTLLPPGLALRREVEDYREGLSSLPSESAVRKSVADLNEKIVRVNRTTFDGPPSNMYPLDVEDVVLTWREHRAAVAAALPDVPAEPESVDSATPPSRGLWRRLSRSPRRQPRLP